MPGLRPLGFGEILDVGIKLYLRHWRPLMLCVVGLVLPVQIITVLALLSVSPDMLDPTATQATIEPGEEDALFAAYGITTLLQGLVYVIATAACFKAVSDAYLGSAPSARRSLGFAVQRLPKLLLLGLMALLAVGLIGGALALLGPVGAVIGILVLIVPWIWLSIAWSLTVPALLFEGGSPWRALGRSFNLVKGRWWPICGILVVGVILVSFLAGILQGILQIVPALLVEDSQAVLAFSTVVAGTVGSVITTPFTAAIVALVYFDQRVRKEGFDLQLLAEGLGKPYDPDELPPAPLLEPEVTPEQRAAAPFWPPPPGWKPPEPEPAPAPAPAAPSEPESPWQPPRAPSWPPEEPPRGSGGL